MQWHRETVVSSSFISLHCGIISGLRPMQYAVFVSSLIRIVCVSSSMEWYSKYHANYPSPLDFINVNSMFPAKNRYLLSVSETLGSKACAKHPPLMQSSFTPLGSSTYLQEKFVPVEPKLSRKDRCVISPVVEVSKETFWNNTRRFWEFIRVSV